MEFFLRPIFWKILATQIARDEIFRIFFTKFYAPAQIFIKNLAPTSYNSRSFIAFSRATLLNASTDIFCCAVATGDRDVAEKEYHLMLENGENPVSIIRILYCQVKWDCRY